MILPLWLAVLERVAVALVAMVVIVVILAVFLWVAGRGPR